MSKELFKLFDNEVRKRDWTKEQQEIDEMARLYEGELPARYKKFFPTNTPEHLVQVIPLAWDDLATQAGRLPDLRGEPRDLTKKEAKAAGLMEKIGFSYLSNSKPTGKVFMKQLAWWMQLGRSVAIVTPDFDKKTPRFEIRDPRSCYPGVAEMTNNTITKLDDLIFKYDLDIETARSMGLANEETQNNRWGEAAKREITIIEYIDNEKWCMVSEHGQSKVSYHNLGMVPGHVFQSYTPNNKAGHNRFRDQLTLAVAISRLITAKMAFADRVTSSTLWTRNYEGMVEIGPDTIIRLGPQGEIGQIGPPTTLQVDQDIQMLNQFSRILNRNPEVRQGEIQAKGQYTSAKTLEQLADAIDTVIGSDWDVIGPGLEYLFSVAYEMDVKLWPNEEKTINGNMKGKRFLDSYVPAEDIAERRTIKVDYGFGVGGYQGFLMHLQAGDAGYMSRQRVMESMPGISDVDEEMNRIDIEKMDEAGKALLQSLAASGQLDPMIWMKMRKLMAEKGMGLHQAFEEVQEDLAARAQAAQPQQPALATPEPQAEAPPEELPGIPPSALAGV